jgi:hypothetical protein
MKPKLRDLNFRHSGDVDDYAGRSTTEARQFAILAIWAVIWVLAAICLVLVAFRVRS